MPDDVFDRVLGILAPSDVFIPGALEGQVTPELVDALARTPGSHHAPAATRRAPALGRGAAVAGGAVGGKCRD